MINFTGKGIEVHVEGKKPTFCGPLKFTVDTVAQPQMCRNANGQSELILCSSDPSIRTENWLAKICAGAEIIFEGGSAVATIKSGGACPTMVSPLEFAVGRDDTFYGTDVDRDGSFRLVGRSSAADKRASSVVPRPPKESMQSCSGAALRP
jgi:hypothetical protein